MTPKSVKRYAKSLADNVYKRIFLFENCWIFIKITEICSQDSNQQ